MKEAKGFYNGLPLWGKAVFWIVIAILIYIAYRKIKIYLGNLKKEEVINTNTVNTTVNNVPVTIDLGAKALTIYDAFYDNDWFGFSEDETKAINALLSVPTNLVPKLSTIYFSLYGKNLKEDFVKYTDFSKVSYKFV